MLESENIQEGKLMKRILAIILSTAICATVMTACQETAKPNETDVTENSIIYSALDEIPYDTENTVSATQLADKLYILEPDGVYKLDLVNAVSECIYNADNLLYITSGDGVIYLSDEGNTIYTIDENGTLLDAIDIPDGALDDVTMSSFMEFIVTDDYFVFAYPVQKGYAHTYIRKDDLSVKTNSSGGFYKIANYEGNKYFTYIDANSSQDTYIISYDIDSGKCGERIYIRDFVVDFCYDDRNNSIKFYSTASFGMALCEFDIETDEKTQLSIFTKDTGVYEWNCETLTGCNNLFVVISDNLNRIEVFDTDKEYPVINMAVVGYPQIETGFLAAKLKDKYNIDVVIKQYDYDERENFALKIMAGDSDIDVFHSTDIDIQDYVKNTAFYDLGTLEVLQENINRCSELLKYGYSYDGKIFGIPYVMNSLYAIDTMEKDSTSFDRGYYLALTAYLNKYFDSVDGTYSDDGTYLYELLKYYYEHPDFDVPCEVICQDTYIISSSCYLMNPAAENKENAALFLNEIMNLCLGEYDRELEDTLFNYLLAHYDTDFDYSSCYPSWRGAGQETIVVISEAITAVQAADNYEDIKRIADEYYSKIRMTVYE